jgi:YaiO family outer membrane protein
MMLWLVMAAQISDPAYAAAVEARTGGRTSQAIEAFEQLSRERASDADVWLNLGLAYMAAGRYSDADRALEATLRLAPTYQDARIAYARSAFFSGRPAVARQRLALALTGNGGGEPEARSLAAQIAAARSEQPVAWRVDLTHTRSELSNGLGQWSSTLFSVGRREGRDTAVLAADRTSRLGRTDVYVEATGARALSGDRDVWLAVGGTPDADYRPKFALRGGGSMRVGPARAWTTRIGVDGALARYGVGDVRGLQPYASLALGERVTLSARSYLTLDEQDEFRAGYALRGDWTVGPDIRLSAGWADAPESSDGRTVKVRAASAAATINFSADLGVQFGFTHEMRDAYNRDEVALAVTKRF